jgi:hypothetical protein
LKIHRAPQVPDQRGTGLESYLVNSVFDGSPVPGV